MNIWATIQPIVPQTLSLPTFGPPVRRASKDKRGRVTNAAGAHRPGRRRLDGESPLDVLPHRAERVRSGAGRAGACSDCRHQHRARREGGPRLRLRARRRGLACHRRRPDHRHRRHLHAERHAFRRGHGGDRGRQARLLREAARQHGRACEADGRGGGGEGGHHAGRLQLHPEPGPRSRAHGDRARRHRRRQSMSGSSSCATSWPTRTCSTPGGTT